MSLAVSLANWAPSNETADPISSQDLQDSIWTRRQDMIEYGQQ
jgi:hypothetical protein